MLAFSRLRYTRRLGWSSKAFAAAIDLVVRRGLANLALQEAGTAMKHQLTGNAGMYHVARELSRRGWHVMLTVRNARGADLYAASEDEKTVQPIQSKALSKKMSVPLGTSLENLRSPWWVITLDANSGSPTCYVMKLQEVKDAAYEGKTGAASFWLETKSYMKDEFKERWDRLGDPNGTTAQDTNAENSPSPDFP